MNFYLTFNEEPVGLFKSQIIDVISFLNREFESDLFLVSFISLRHFFTHRRIIKSCDVKSIVLPSFPKLRFFKINFFFLYFICLKYKPKGIIARNIFAGFLALKCRDYKIISKVVYDGRGFIKAESEEYKIFPKKVAKMISYLESFSVNRSDFLMAITQEMIHAWKRSYNFNKNNFVVIPNTLGEKFRDISIDSNNINAIRLSLGFKSDDIVLIYSGSTAKWQSIDNIITFCKSQLEINPKVKVLFLSNQTIELNQLIADYPTKVFRMWLDSNLITKYLLAADYGLLIRNQSITNSVSFSTKFAEYLSCGLKVITSEFMSISNFVEINNIGFIVKKNSFKFDLEKPTTKEKIRICDFASHHFSKSSHSIYSKYQEMLSSFE